MDRYYSVDKIPLSIHCLTTVEKLFHICQKALAHIWKSFSTSVKNMKSYDFPGLTHYKFPDLLKSIYL